MKSPKWQRDEIILALDLYFSLEPKEMDKSNQKVIELSKILNSLPLIRDKENFEKFRNPNGVALKLNNFKALDSSYNGSGMKAFSKLDQEIFNEFVDNKKELGAIARNIISAMNNSSTLYELNDFQESYEDDFDGVKEGKVIYKLHKLRERNAGLNRKKKDRYLKKFGKLDCEVCGFDFYQFYGEIGFGFIEAHHRTPLSELNAETKTRLEDLALVCSNCHRMLHKSSSNNPIQTLSKLITNHKLQE